MPRQDSAVRQTIFSPLPSGSRTTNVAAALRAAILNGDLPPGAVLREVRIASDLGVSRAPVREALRMLQEEGLVTKKSYRGAFVAPVRAELAHEIRSIRLRIEPFAAERSINALIQDNFIGLESAVRRIESADAEADASAAVDSHLAFHRTFYELADHRLLRETWRSLESGLRLSFLLDQLSLPTSRELGSHRALLDCLKGGDIVAVRAELKAHIDSSTARSTSTTNEQDRLAWQLDHQQPEEN